MISGIVLAGGASRRMGAPKALLDCQGQTFVGRICRAMLAARVGELVVVVGANADTIRAALPADPAIRSVDNPRYKLGQLSSLMVGVQALSTDSEAAVVTLVDHPLVQADTICGLIASFRSEPISIIIATHHGKRGHPVLFSSQLYGEILAAPLDQGAKVVVRKDPGRVRHLSLDDPGIVADIDTPRDYARWVRSQA
jgi:molybdenum cofactor cytidylyltransferase